MEHKKTTEVIAALLLLAACGPVSRAPIPGKYEFWNGPKARLELLRNLTYRLCVESKPCGDGVYDVEAPRAFSDDTYRLCSARRPDECGMPFRKENFLDVTRIYFDPGEKGPMKKFNYPPDGKIINGKGEDITTQGSEASTIEYDWSGQPSFTFTDPDSGLYFRRVSD